MENSCEKCKCLTCNYSCCGHCTDCQESSDDKPVTECQWYRDSRS